MLRLPLHSRRSLVAARTSVALQRRFAAELMSTVWIVPFLMFFDVTIMVAAVPLASHNRSDDCCDKCVLHERAPFLEGCVSASSQGVGLLPERRVS
jgi:hypothetical protein